ncbi:hypothetical protein GGX14DRAFT_395429 [Mycena pura]|uniref:Uncharacterized protein n=1 Tax=Mycena pura TaxID=153505 RepID=A0AAD6VGX0_9AGAR|nr:hypothetical protein GGX14DRAFT_395429 [Mycena pura]
MDASDAYASPSTVIGVLGAQVQWRILHPHWILTHGLEHVYPLLYCNFTARSSPETLRWLVVSPMLPRILHPHWILMHGLEHVYPMLYCNFTAGFIGVLGAQVQWRILHPHWILTHGLEHVYPMLYCNFTAGFTGVLGAQVQSRILHPHWTLTHGLEHVYPLLYCNFTARLRSHRGHAAWHTALYAKAACCRMLGGCWVDVGQMLGMSLVRWPGPLSKPSLDQSFVFNQSIESCKCIQLTCKDDDGNTVQGQKISNGQRSTHMERDRVDGLLREAGVPETPVPSQETKSAEHNETSLPSFEKFRDALAPITMLCITLAAWLNLHVGLSLKILACS